MSTHLQVAKKLSSLLDSKFQLFQIRFGIDPLLGLIPGGDLISGLLSLYIVWIGFKLHVSKKTKMRMILNIALDLLISLVPVLGDAADFFFKSNTKNIKLLEEELYLVQEADIVS